MPMGYELYPIIVLCCDDSVCMAVSRIHTYRRGVCVARFDEQGNAKASKSETGNRWLHVSFLYPVLCLY